MVHVTLSLLELLAMLQVAIESEQYDLAIELLTTVIKALQRGDNHGS